MKIINIEEEKCVQGYYTATEAPVCHSRGPTTTVVIPFQIKRIFFSSRAVRIVCDSNRRPHMMEARICCKEIKLKKFFNTMLHNIP